MEPLPQASGSVARAGGLERLLRSRQLLGNSLRLLDFLDPEETVEELQATEKAAAIKELLEAMWGSRAFPRTRARDIYRALLAREKLGSTGIGNGLAVPHAKHASVKRVKVVLGRSRKGVNFAALDGEMVYIIFLLVSPANKPDDHLRAMQKLSLILKDRDYCRFLRQARDKKELVELLHEADERFVESR